jgi:plastocyanin
MRWLRRSMLWAGSLVMLVGACSTAVAGSGPPPTPPAGGAVIVAQGVAFDRTRLDVPAAVAVPLLFENRDSVPHNVTILDEAGGTVLFVGAVLGGPGSRTYSLPALAAGRYVFRCDVHTYMAGTLVAGPMAVGSGL